MRIRSSEVDNRATFILDKSIQVGQSIGYIKFGENNDYPDLIEKVILGSATGKACASIMARFIVGKGFADENINNAVVSNNIIGKPITLLEMLRQAAYSVAFNNGFYILVAPDLEGNIRDTKFIPFKNCRFSNPDDIGYSAYVAVYDNWAKNTDKKFDKSKVKEYYTYNSNKKIIQAQAVEGVHKGQIYSCFIDQNYIYPLSPFDSCYLDLDTEQELSKHKNNEVRNGFTSKKIVFTPAFDNEHDQLDFDKQMKKFMGSRGDKLLCVEAEFDEKGEIKAGSGLKTQDLSSNIDDKLYDNWDKLLSNNIRKSANAIPSIFLDYDENKLGGTSGESIIQATNFYNAMTLDIRKSIEVAFKEVYSKFIDSNNYLEMAQDWSIKPLELYGNVTKLG